MRGASRWKGNNRSDTYARQSVGTYVRTRGRIPIVWHDILIHYPSAMDVLSKEAVIAFWHYDWDDGYPALEMFKKAGFKTIMATGLCLGALTNRREQAFKLALAEAEKYSVDGFMVTTWLDGRYERQKMNLELSGSLLAGKSPGSALIDAVSIITLLDKNRSNVFLCNKWTEMAWEKYSDCRELLLAKINRNSDAEKNIYTRHHFPEGPLYEKLRAYPASAVKRVEPALFGSKIISAVRGKTFDIEEHDSEPAGKPSDGNAYHP